MANERETATAQIGLRVKPSEKALAVQMAAADGRSLANYLMHLVRQDADRKQATDETKDA
jgi:uncharacterized protein (DUF1778 family)